VFPAGIAEPDLIITDERGVARKIGSEPEWWIYNSLKQYNLEFDYQVDERGGKRMPGGMVVDFVVRAGIVTALEYLGAYWHTGRFGVNDALKWAYLARIYDRVLLLADEPMPSMGGWVTTDVVVDQESSNRVIRKYFV
jgi:hypothetical protein